MKRAVVDHRNYNWDEYLQKKNRRRGKTAILLLLGSAGLIALFMKGMGGRQYLLFSLFLLALIMGIFFWNFERRKPRAREIVMLATLTSFAVATNEICAHTIPLHAGTTMVVISGIALGPEAGLLVGALSRLLCNFFDGQGPWTPWQMLAWGMLGYLAGLAFNKIELRSRVKDDKHSLADQLALEKKRMFQVIEGPLVCILTFWVIGYLLYLFGGHSSGESFFGWRLYAFGLVGLLVGSVIQRKKLPVDAITTTVFTFVTVFILYGGLMNFASMILTYSVDPSAGGVSWEALQLLYLTGAPYDAAHAGAAALCMFLFGDSILQKIQRVQVKFGILF